MTGKELKEQAIKEYGTIKQFAALLNLDYNHVFNLLNKNKPGDIEYLLRLKSRIKVARSKNLTPELVAQIKSAINLRGGYSKFVYDSQGKYAVASLSSIINGQRKRISKTIEELLYDLGIWQRK